MAKTSRELTLQSESPDTTPNPDPEPVRFGMMTGVYVPTLLTILLENRYQRTCSYLEMAGNRDEPTTLLVQDMDMANQSGVPL